jgi:hypothetical protein
MEGMRRFTLREILSGLNGSGREPSAGWLNRCEEIRTMEWDLRFIIDSTYLFNKPGEKPSFSSSCRVPDLGDQKLGFFRPEILSRYDSTAKRCFGVEKPDFSLERRAILNRNPVFAADS